MPDVKTMLSWRLPPTFIFVVLLLKTSQPLLRDTLDFMEMFAGEAAITRALREVSWFIGRCRDWWLE